MSAPEARWDPSTLEGLVEGEVNRRLGERVEEADRLRQAAQAVADWWAPENAKTRWIQQWFGETLPNLRAALSGPEAVDRLRAYHWEMTKTTAPGSR